jgi:8-oxo-dGTP diphosphatase
MEHSKNFPDCFHRVTIKGLCVRDGKVLLVHESKALSGKWEMPGGGLDFEEDIQLGFRREVEEEMGLKVRKMSKSPVYVWTHKYKNKRNLDWYYSIVITYRIDFENLDITPTDECEDIKFFSKEELKNTDLNEQTNELADIFDPKDFEQLF